jgi:hypothetical protein
MSVYRQHHTLIGNDVVRWDDVARQPVMTLSEAAVEANERRKKTNCPS